MTEHKRHLIERAPVREEWLAQRAPFIGASEAAALFGDHPFITLGDLAIEKLHPSFDRDETAAMRRGNLLEEAVAQWWAVEHGCDIAEAPNLFMVDDVLIATLDRLVLGEQCAKKVGLEVKTTAMHVDGVEPYWWWQAQAQCVAADLDHVEFAVLDASMSLRSFTVQRDEEAGDRIIEEARKLLDIIKRGEMPPEAPVSYRTAQALYPTPSGERIELPQRAHNVLTSLRAVQQRIAALRIEEDHLKGMLTVDLGDASEGTIDDRVVCTWRAVTTHTIDAKRLRADLPHVADAYSRASTSRRLLLK